MPRDPRKKKSEWKIEVSDVRNVTITGPKGNYISLTLGTGEGKERLRDRNVSMYAYVPGSIGSGASMSLPLSVFDEALDRLVASREEAPE